MVEYQVSRSVNLKSYLFSASITLDKWIQSVCLLFWFCCALLTWFHQRRAQESMIQTSALVFHRVHSMEVTMTCLDILAMDTMLEIHTVGDTVIHIFIHRSQFWLVEGDRWIQHKTKSSENNVNFISIFNNK